eukprot:TRINITY_DN21467_c0_g1_i1.p1 TRINITY_DN21467_c0_g1~~TRINITY_DN21467_c0_g1_i1.p1  ORF type:complete len:358 (+),score=48.38 TRINITY_DN21467_c0_g1_i1:63-1136(+)
MSEAIMLGTWDAKRLVVEENGQEDDIKLCRGHSTGNTKGTLCLSNGGKCYTANMNSGPQRLRGKSEGYTMKEIQNCTHSGTVVADAGNMYILTDKHLISMDYHNPNATPEILCHLPSTFSTPSIVLVRNMLYLYSGGEKHLGRIFAYDTETKNTTLESLPTTGMVPPKRSGQGLIAVAEKYLFLYGGCDDDRELYVYDIEEKCWYCVEMRGSEEVMPPALSGHSMSLCGEMILIFGGFVGGTSWSTNTEMYVGVIDKLDSSVTWHLGRAKNPNDNSKPSSRGYHDALLVSVSPEQTSLVIIGGVNQSEEQIKTSPVYLLHFLPQHTAPLPLSWTINKDTVKRRTTCNTAMFCDCVIC